MSVVLRVYFTITPGKYEEANKLMKQLLDLNAKYGIPKGRVLAGHFVSPGQPNWHWEAEFPSVSEAQAALDKYDEMPEMASFGPATYSVWNQQGVELYHVVEFD
jgi:hypothetical protein